MVMEKNGQLDPKEGRCTCGKQGVVVVYRDDTDVYLCKQCLEEERQESRKEANLHGTMNAF